MLWITFPAKVEICANNPTKALSCWQCLGRSALFGSTKIQCEISNHQTKCHEPPRESGALFLQVFAPVFVADVVVVIGSFSSLANAFHFLLNIFIASELDGLGVLSGFFDTESASRGLSRFLEVLIKSVIQEIVI